MNWKRLLLASALGALAACSSGTPSPGEEDTGVEPVDTGTPPADTGTPQDTGTAMDTGTPQDTGTPEDTGMPPEDTGTPPVDTTPMCNAGEMVCGGGCVDTSTSTLHCGMCDRACGPSEVCRTGMCQPAVMCTAPQVPCAGGCVDPTTDAAHCGMCGRACAAGETCQGGTCRAPRMCPAGQTDCTPTMPSMTCVDTQTSTTHCGSCGTACAAGETCVMGVCQPPACPSGQTRCMASGVATCVNTMTDNANCGTCGNACPMGQACMGGTCQSTCTAPRLTCTVEGMMVCLDVQTDNANCGMCGRACPSGQTCQAGRCACPTGRTACAGTCADLQSDEANCGMCGRRCGTGQSCVRGTCACPTGQTACGTGTAATCVNTQTDTNNCGMCARRCTAPATCSAGVCNSLCGVGTTSCGGRCVAITSFLTDNTNCGRCGNACTTGNSCQAGVCRPTNDARLNAAVITLSTTREVTVTGTTNDATRDGPSVPCICTSSSGNVWYRFTVPTPGGVVYLDTAGSAYDTSLFITTSAGAAIPGQTATGFTGAGACNDDSGCGTGGGFTSGNQARTAALLAPGTYYVAVGGCGTGSFTLRAQYLPRNLGTTFVDARLNGTGNTGSVTVGAGASVTSGSCGGVSGTDTVRWFLTCGATQRQLFSVCRSDPSASYTRRISGSTTTYDPVIYVRSAQTGAQVSCNDDSGSDGGAIDCRGTIPFGPFNITDTARNAHFGSRLTGLNTPRGLGAVFLDSIGTNVNMRYNMRYETP